MPEKDAFIHRNSSVFGASNATCKPSTSAAPDAKPAPYPPLSTITRPTVPTAQAAYYLDRAPQTLRMWAMKDGTGPVRPLRVHGILAWPVAELRRVLGVAV